MRDNYEGMPEIISASERDGQYFGVVGIEKNGRHKKVRFGISYSGYKALKRILQLRPFDTMPGLEHSYFYAGSISKTNQTEIYKISVRVEQGKDSKNIEAEAPRDLVANLQWFYEMRDLKDAGHLPEEA